MYAKRLALSLSIVLSSVVATPALAQVACDEGYRAYAVSGRAISQSIDEASQEGFIALSLTPAQGRAVAGYKGTYVGRIVGVDQYGLPIVNHDFKLYHRNEGHVWMASRGDNIVTATVAKVCGPDQFEIQVTEQLTYFPIASGSLSGAHGEIQATGTINAGCKEHNAFSLTGTLCLLEASEG